MRSAAQFVFDLLASVHTGLELGTPLSQDSWALYKDAVPSEPKRCVAVFETPSAGIDVPLERSGAYTETPYVQIRIRGLTRDEAIAKMDDVRDYLCAHAHRNIEETANRIAIWQAIRDAGRSFVAQDSSQLTTVIQNFQLVRTVKGKE